VANYLSEEWFEQVGAAADEGAAGLTEATLVLQHTVIGSAAGEVCYHLRLASDTAEIVRGPAARPDVTFSEDYETAAAVASGALSAPAALIAGRIRVGGDMGALIAHPDILAITDPVPAAVRAATTY
jgi:putative sterol carrier protein